MILKQIKNKTTEIEKIKQNRKKGERGREVRGVSGASRRKQEVARGTQEVAEASRARATPRLCLLAEEDDRRGEWRWAGPCWAR